MAVDTGAGAAGPAPAQTPALAADTLGVFISYSRDDIETADWLDVTLDSNGFAPTLDRQGISGAENWQERLGAMIRDADTEQLDRIFETARNARNAWLLQDA